MLSFLIVAVPTVKATDTQGELYLWVGWWINEVDAERIANASDSLGLQIWIDAGNWGAPQLTTDYIDYFHTHNVKVVCRIWSNGGSTDIELLKHGTMEQTGWGSVDYQMDIGPEIDAFMIDETYQGNASYYQELATYIHGLGKLMFVNTGMGNIEDITPTYADRVSTEHDWNYLIDNEQALIAQYPAKFIGISTDFGYIWQASLAATINEAPTYTAPMTLQRAYYDIKKGWNNGVFSMQASSDDDGIIYLPDYFEALTSAIMVDSAPEPTPTPFPNPTFPPNPSPTPYADPTGEPTFLTTTIFGMDSSLLFLCVGGLVGMYIVTQTVRGKRYD